MVGLRLEIGGTMHLEKYDPSEWNNTHLHVKEMFSDKKWIPQKPTIK